MCRMWSLVDLEHKTRHQVFSRAQSFHASTIAIIVTLALPQIHLKVWPLFNWMYNKHLVQVTHLLLPIVRQCSFGPNCRVGYSHFHLPASPISSSLLYQQSKGGEKIGAQFAQLKPTRPDKLDIRPTLPHLAGKDPRPGSATLQWSLHPPTLPLSSSASSLPAAR